MTAGRPGSSAEAPRYFLGRRGSSHLGIRPTDLAFSTRTFVSRFTRNSSSRFFSEIGGKMTLYLFLKKSEDSIGYNFHGNRSNEHSEHPGHDISYRVSKDELDGR